jgi:hypothetical protein
MLTVPPRRLARMLPAIPPADSDEDLGAIDRRSFCRADRAIGRQCRDVRETLGGASTLVPVMRLRVRSAFRSVRVCRDACRLADAGPMRIFRARRGAFRCYSRRRRLRKPTPIRCMPQHRPRTRSSCLRDACRRRGRSVLLRRNRSRHACNLEQAVATRSSALRSQCEPRLTRMSADGCAFHLAGDEPVKGPVFLVKQLAKRPVGHIPGAVSGCLQRVFGPASR